MSYQRIRHALRIATFTVWTAALVAAVVCTITGVDATVGRVLIVTTLLAVITCAELSAELIIAMGEHIAAAQPTAQQIAARAILLGREITRDQYEAGAHLPRLSDYRGR